MINSMIIYKKKVATVCYSYLNVYLKNRHFPYPHKTNKYKTTK